MTMNTMEELLARDGKLVYKTRGVSMEPMLRQDRDLVMIRVPDSRLSKYDVALYKRGGSCVLHRVIQVRKDSYLIRGDNTYVDEIVPDSAVIGVLTGFRRKGRQISVTDAGYRLYARCWTAVYPLRRFCRWLIGRLKDLAGKLGIISFIRGRKPHG